MQRGSHKGSESFRVDRATNFGGPLTKKGPKSATFNIPGDTAPMTMGQTSTSSSFGNSNDDEAYLEITLDIRDDSDAVHSVKTARDGIKDPEVTQPEKRTSVGSSIVRNTASRIKQVSQELRKLASLSRKPSGGKFDRNKSAAAHALKSLKFISKTDGGAGWAAVEKRFNDLAAPTNGLLPKALFGECIGMNRESKEFAGELFSALARRRNIRGDSINKEHMQEFWEQIADQSFDSRLQTFFDNF